MSTQVQGLQEIVTQHRVGKATAVCDALFAEAEPSMTKKLAEAMQYVHQKQARFEAARETYIRLVGAHVVPGDTCDLTRMPCAVAAESAMLHADALYKAATVAWAEVVYAAILDTRDAKHGPPATLPSEPTS